MLGVSCELKERCRSRSGHCSSRAPTSQVRGSIVVSISACHAEDPGSIPGRGVASHNAWRMEKKAKLHTTVKTSDWKSFLIEVRNISVIEVTCCCKDNGCPGCDNSESGNCGSIRAEDFAEKSLLENDI